MQTRRPLGKFVALAVVGLVALAIPAFFVYDDWARARRMREYEASRAPLSGADKETFLNEIAAARTRDRGKNAAWYEAIGALAAGNTANVPSAPCAGLDGERYAHMRVFRTGEDLAKVGPHTGYAVWRTNAERLDFLEKQVAAGEKWTPFALKTDLAELRAMPTHVSDQDETIVIADVLNPPVMTGSGYLGGVVSGVAFWFDRRKQAFVCRAPIASRSKPRLTFDKKRGNEESAVLDDFSAGIDAAIRTAFGLKP